MSYSENLQLTNDYRKQNTVTNAHYNGSKIKKSIKRHLILGIMAHEHMLVNMPAF